MITSAGMPFSDNGLLATKTKAEVFPDRGDPGKDFYLEPAV